MAQPKKQYAITFKFQERFNLEPITIIVKSSSDARAYFNAPYLAFNFSSMRSNVLL